MKTKTSVKNAMKELALEKLRAHQIEPVNTILDYRDTMVIYPTGAGKSAIYQIPALVRKPWLTLVISPTIALMYDQVKSLQDLDIPAAYLSVRNAEEHGNILKQVKRQAVVILYVTPERLQQLNFQSAMKDNPPWLIVVDEAHCLLDWGHTFRPDYLKIREFIAKLPQRPVVTAMTATAPETYQREIGARLGLQKPAIFTHSLNRPNIILLRENCSELSLQRRLSRVNYNIKKYGKTGRVIVYCATKRYVDLVANYLKSRFPGEVVKCHSYMEERLREKHEWQMIRGTKRIMVATTAFGMGVDLPDIRLVLHFNLPLSAIDYYQQIGRAGRDGEPSHALLLYHPDDVSLNDKILSGEASPNIQAHLKQGLDAMLSICHSKGCLMQRLLSVLGEPMEKTCKHCTNCQRARRGLL